MAYKELGIDVKILGIIDSVIKEKREELNDIIDEAANIAADLLQENSPRSDTAVKNSRRYYKGWKKEGSRGDWIVNNKNKPSLTYILSEGTEKRVTNKGYKRGQVIGNFHIDDAFDAAKKHIETELKKLGG